MRIDFPGRVRLPSTDFQFDSDVANVLLDKCSDGLHLSKRIGCTCGQFGDVLLYLRRGIAPSLEKRAFPAAHFAPSFKAFPPRTTRRKQRHKEASYSLQLPSGWEYKVTWLNHPAIQPTSVGSNQWQWVVTDVPAIRKEDDMPPMARTCQPDD